MAAARIPLTRWSSVGAIGIAVAGIAVVKWWPYGTRLFEGNVRFGGSLLDAPPLDYALRYLAAVWPAMVVGVLIAALVDSMIPHAWLERVLGRASLRSSVIGGVAGMPTMMCSCCAAPVAVGMRNSGASVGAAIAFWLGNPLLNPAVVAFLLLTLPWQFTLLRVVAGVVLVFGVAHLVARMASDAPIARPSRLGMAGPRTFPATLARYALTLLPEWAVLGLLLGFARAWLLPAIPQGDAGAIGIAAAAVGGTLFMIPTAGEIPIAQALRQLGVGAGPVAALIVTLPALSLPSLAMVWGSFPARALLATTALVALVGALAGVVAPLMGLS